MEACLARPQANEDAEFLDALPVHVVAALDHVTPAERRGVRAAVEAFARHEQEGAAIPGPEPLFVLWAAPQLCVIARRNDPAAAVAVEDMVRPATLRLFAHAHGA
jgi:hypothetical protein